MLPAHLLDMDDFIGMVDFELGVRINYFVGAPFSSFSVMIALWRAAIAPSSNGTNVVVPGAHTDMVTGTDTRPPRRDL